MQIETDTPAGGWKADSQSPFEWIHLRPEGGPWTFVPLRSGLVAPQRFLAESETLSLEVELSGSGKPRIIAVQVHDAAGITSETLRQLPLGRLTKQAVATAAIEPAQLQLGPSEGKSTAKLDLEVPVAEPYQRYRADARHPQRGVPLSDENLRQVVELYRVAAERGDPPTQTVADVMRVARSTAARWVMRARERDLLGPAVRGKGGEGTS